MSSWFSSRGACMTSLNENDSFSKSNLVSVISSSFFQWRFFMALSDINSMMGQVRLKSSILFFRSRNAGHVLSPLGSLRQLHISKVTQIIQSQLVIIFCCLAVGTKSDDKPDRHIGWPFSHLSYVLVSDWVGKTIPITRGIAVIHVQMSTSQSRQHENLANWLAQSGPYRNWNSSSSALILLGSTSAHSKS